MADASEVRPVVLDVNGFFEHMLGAHGLGSAEVETALEAADEILAGLAARRNAGELPFFSLPYDSGGIERIEAVAASLRQRFSTLLVLGIGGSALGTKAVLDAIGRQRRRRDGLRVEVLDNIDPVTIATVLEGLDLERTACNVISKSGQTAETMSQFLIVRERLLEAVGASSYRDHVVCTTDPDGGSLRALAEAEGLATLPVPPGVGGRFSVLSAVGLLPLAVAGVDIAALCAGARAMDERTSLRQARRNPAGLHAALIHHATKSRHVGIHVLMPYSDGLLRLAEWYAQLWAESLGKRVALDGSVVETGHTPLRALGATDQHSQVQLFVEGPRDKIVTFIRVRSHDCDLTIPSSYADNEALSYLGGLSLGELLNMEQRATELALAEAGRLSSVITVEEVDEAALGQLFQFFQVQTLVMGGLLGIDALDQPGVEAGKRMTCALAGRSGYEQLAVSVKRRLAAKREDLVLG